MKRFLRIMLNLSAAFFAVLAIAASAAWTRSKERVEGVSYMHISTEKTLRLIACSDRRLLLARMTDPLEAGEFVYLNQPEGWYQISEVLSRVPHDTHWYTLVMINPPDFSPSFLGVATQSGRINIKGRYAIAAIPLGPVAIVTAILPALRLVFAVKNRSRRRQRLKTGCCLQCGYDLRATPAATGPRLARCPECGAEDNTQTAGEHS